MGVLRGEMGANARSPQATSVKPAIGVPRETAPTLATVRHPGGAFPRAQLIVASSGLTARRGTAFPGGRMPETKTGVRGHEHRGGFRASPEVAAKLATAERRLLDQGHVLNPGDVILLKMPNARRDDQEPRPSLEVTGDQMTRVVMLDRVGAPLGDHSLETGTLQMPVGVDRIALAGLGAPRIDARGRDGAGLSGWHAQTTVQQISSNTYLAGASIIRSAAPRTRRTGSAVTVANTTAREATFGRTVTTHLPQNTTVVLVGLAPTEPVTSPQDAFASVTLGLFGADRATRLDGTKVRPRVVTTGDQIFGVFAVHPNDQGGRWVTITIESDDRWNVIAVAGTTGRPESLVDDLQDKDPADLIRRPIDPAGAGKVRFVPASERLPRQRARSSR
jgi:hypothetical protein